jgi:N-acetylmuramic acid 6-phosphate etherase
MNNLFNEISKLNTEQVNPDSIDVDLYSTEDILKTINKEDAKVSDAVLSEIKNITIATDLIYSKLSTGGRLFYFGAGTSGRLGVLDSAECPPTFGTNPEMIQGIIAGGQEAMFVAQEGAEDSYSDGENQIEFLNITDKDIVCGIAASGRTPFVLGVLAKAKSKNIKTVFINTIGHQQSKELYSKLNVKVDCLISINVGPEVIMGSTRMKSGTAQKLVLNMMSTAVMVKMGKTYNNIMVDLQMTNAKLKERAKRTVMMICGIDYEQASTLLEASNYHVKSAIVMKFTECDLQTAKAKLSESNGFVKKAIQE